jgi:hypothetical protein
MRGGQRCGADESEQSPVRSTGSSVPGLADYATYIVLAPVIGGEAAAQVILACEEEPNL